MNPNMLRLASLLEEPEPKSRCTLKKKVHVQTIGAENSTS
jgi:hypothetical protein